MNLLHVQREYDSLAASYDGRWARYVRATTTLALEQQPLAAHALLLDVGCGTGVLMQRAREQQPECRLLGVDPSHNMLQEAARRLAGAAALVRGSGAALPVADASVDVAVATNALHYLPDPMPALAEMRRVLVPGGTVVVVDWCADYWTMRLLGRMLTLLGRAHGRTLHSEQLVQAMRRAGFAGVSVTRTKIDRFWGIMTARGVAGAVRSGTGASDGLAVTSPPTP